MKKSFKNSIVLVVAIFLSACGDGGSNTAAQDSKEETKTTITGVIVDAQISGLRYDSRGPNGEKSQGLTNLKGEYEYFEGGETTFSVGGIEVAKTIPKKMLSITTLVKTDTEKTNLARFLQTLDSDKNPENGISIVNTAVNALDVKDIDFGDGFEADFTNAKVQLLGSNAETTSLVTSKVATEHASKSERLSSLQQMDLYKAIANEKNYMSEYYNTDVLENDQRKRVYLWIWEKILAKEMAIENDLATQEFDVNKVEEERDKYKKYLDYADSVVSISSLGAGAYEQLAKAGTRTMSYELTNLASLTISGCDAVVKLTNVDTSDSVELDDADLCKNMMKVLNPVGDSTDKLAVANPILSGFLPEALPIIMRYKKMNWLHFDTKTLRSLGKFHVSKPNLISLGISIAGIVNDSAGAYRASNINKELTSRLVAQEWLSVWFRSGFNQKYMNKLINNNQTLLVGNKAQIEAIALKFGTSGALCDAYHFFNRFYDCSGIENINYDYQKVADIINEKLSKSNALYRNFGEMTGSFSDGEGTIGVIDIGWVADENLTDIGEPIRLSGKLSITNLDGIVYSSIPNDIKVRYAQCDIGNDGGAGYMFSKFDSPISVDSNGNFLVELNPLNFNEKNAVECAAKFFGIYGFQFYRDINSNGTIDDEDIYIGDWTTNTREGNKFDVVHMKMENKKISIPGYDFKGDEFISVMANYTSSGGRNSDEFSVAKVNMDGSFDIDKYIKKSEFYYKYDEKKYRNYDYLDYYVFSSDKEVVNSNQAMDGLYNGNFITISEDISTLKNSKQSTVFMGLKKNSQIDALDMNTTFSGEKLVIKNGNYTIASRCTKKVYISNDEMSTLDVKDINDIYSREWSFIHSNTEENYHCSVTKEDDSTKTMSCETDLRGENYRAIITETCEGKWTITDLFNLE